MSRLTTPEKIAMLHQYAPAVPRLGLGGFRTGTEALHGASWLGEATVFPQAVGLGATWHPELVAAVGEATAVEVRALHAKDPAVSLNVWAPTVNLLRDPRWGRNEEGYSEDVLLTAHLAISYCRGLRGSDPYYVRTAPTLKHFLAYNNEIDRSETSSAVRPRVLHEYDLPVFTRVIAAGVVDAVMPSYNLVNGRPNHVSPYLDGVLRKHSDREIVVVTDAEAPSNLVDTEQYFEDHVIGHAAALRAGVDSFTDHGADPSLTVARLTQALGEGVIADEDIDRAVGRLLELRIRTGEFDPDIHPYSSISRDALDTPEHRALARRAAREQIVLLKNTENLLPLARGTKPRIAVVGPFALDLRTDHYSGTMPYRVDVAQGLADALTPFGGEVIGTDAMDRVKLLATSVDRPVRVDLGAAHPLLTCAAGTADDSELFDLLDWGDGVSTLRSAVTGRYVTVQADPPEAAGSPASAPERRGRTAALIADRVQPDGWATHETFTFVEQPDGTRLLRNVCTDKYVTLDPETGELVATAQSPEVAERFELRLVRSGIERALQLVRDTDVAIVVVGNDTHINGRETQDRTTLALPPAQEELVREVARAQPRTVLVVMSSYPYAVTWAHAHVPSILWTSHAGQETGNAVADVVFGEHAPTGRLSQTWYRADEDLPDLLDYDIIKARRTYLYFDGEPLYPFGHGLTYTTFRYGRIQSTVDSRKIAVRLEVTNDGQRDGVEVVQLYSRPVSPAGERPSRQLRAFARVELAAGQTRTVELEFPVAELAYWDVATGEFRVDAGEHELMAGRSCADIRSSTRVVVSGTNAGMRDVLGIEVRAADFDDYEGVTLVDTTRASGDAVTPAGDSPGWVVFRSVHLDRPAQRITARVSRTGAGEAELAVRRDDPVDGVLLGSVRIASTGDRYAWTTVSSGIDAPPGTYDLYVVLDGEQRLDSFRLEA
ncbi:glycoside hydrolase family 3 C-terminal domain-containing protein [Amycolatopsis sp. NPDC049253]|uniref:glycoside hydrolase family 3 C-terminal domain-containing protein n=1 Tax=Amycolatopsis sp. NPDC049253 TaxID=3155274 RepID=UPI00342530F3